MIDLPIYEPTWLGKLLETPFAYRIHRLDYISLRTVLSAVLRLRTVTWCLNRLGYEPINFDLGIENTLLCRNCGLLDEVCECGNRYLYLANTAYTVNGSLATPEVFWAEVIRHRQVCAYGQIIQRKWGQG